MFESKKLILYIGQGSYKSAQFYSNDFLMIDVMALENQLQIYILDMWYDTNFSELWSIDCWSEPNWVVLAVPNQCQVGTVQQVKLVWLQKPSPTPAFPLPSLITNHLPHQFDYKPSPSLACNYSREALSPSYTQKNPCLINATCSGPHPGPSQVSLPSLLPLALLGLEFNSHPSLRIKVRV